MPNLEWSDALALELPAMDDTHREFVELLAQVETAADSALLAHWRVLLDHTGEHFTREDRWMQDTRFSSTNCHSVQHKVVLQVCVKAWRLPRRASWRRCATWRASWPSGSPSMRRPWTPRWPCTCAAQGTTRPRVW